jgi:threonine dehydratase
MPQNYIEKILRSKVYDVAIETPLDFASPLFQRGEADVS